MSYMLFMDESGHDHHALPYEVRGGICLEVGQVWEFTQKMKRLEFACFGDHLRNYGSEIKATKLLEKKRFKWAAATTKFPAEQRRELARGFLARTARGENPPPDMWRAYGQASIEMARGLISLLGRNDVYAFASLIPKGSARKPDDVPEDFIRKDLTFLFERFYYFLEDQNSNGLLVLDETDRVDDRRYLRRMERYFSAHDKGRQHSGLILPSPLFTGSEMSYAIQAADVLIYILATAYRPPHSDIQAVRRDDVSNLVGGLLPKLVYKTTRTAQDGTRFRSESIFLVEEPWGAKEVKASQTGVVFRAPQKASLQLYDATNRGKVRDDGAGN